VSQTTAVTDAAAPPIADEPLLVRAARGRQGDALPVWFIRQAGRSLPEYQRVRAGIEMLEACQRPDLVAEITCQPVRRHGVDAAIVFSDIMVPLAVAGIDVHIEPGVGPVVAEPVRTAGDVDALPELDPARLDFLVEAIGLIRAEVGTTPVIGFAGAPFTLASYLVEGRPSRDYARTKALMAADPELWDRLCGRLAEISATFLRAQIEAGASVVQLFDSWAGSLAPADYRARVQPHSAHVLSAASAVPRIHFGVGCGELLGAMADAGADVVGTDWRVGLAEASRRAGGRPVQGNLDPVLLQAPWPVVAEHVRAVVRDGARASGHVFNLGHGVPPTTDADVLTRIVELVHAEGPALRGATS